MPRLPPDAPGAGSVDPADHPPIAIPDADWEWFRTRASEVVSCDVDPYRAVCEALFGHLAGVNRWLNLTRVDDARGWLRGHVLDSLLGLHCGAIAQGSGIALDLGSGGGYPGLPLALLGPSRPWCLVDSRARKVRFLAAAGALVDADRVYARAFRGREARSAAPDLLGAVAVVSSRATGSPENLAPEVKDLLVAGGRLVVWQGPNWDRAASAKALAQGPMRLGEVTAYRLDANEPERYLVEIIRR